MDGAAPLRVDPATILAVVPVLNEADHIEATLRTVLSPPRMAAVSVVVADGGSTDGTQAIVARLAARHPNLRLIENPARLQAAAVNRAVALCAEARHAILVRIDAHAAYPPDYVLSVAESLVAHGTDALATVLDSRGTTAFQRGAAWAVDGPLGSGGSAHRGGRRSGYVDHGHHAGFRLDTFRVVGGYDPGFVANEDAELDHRIGLAGGRIWLDAGIRLGYVVRPSLGALARQYWRYGRGRAQTVAKHRMRPRLRQMVPPAATAANAAALAAAPLLPAALAVPALYAAALAAVTARALLRRRDPAALWIGPALAAMHHAWGAGFLRQMAMR